MLRLPAQYKGRLGQGEAVDRRTMGGNLRSSAERADLRAMDFPGGISEKEPPASRGSRGLHALRDASEKRPSGNQMLRMLEAIAVASIWKSASSAGEKAKR